MSCLTEAAEQGITLVALQETNVKEASVPSVTNACSRQGWQILQVPAPPNSAHRGGVAICCREPMGMVQVQTHSSSAGLVGFMFPIIGMLLTRKWLASAMGGIRRAVGRHQSQSSSYPIDAIWSSQDLAVADAQSGMPGHGDHSVAQVTWNVALPKSGLQQLRFAHTCRLLDTLPEDTSVPWEQVAVSPSVWQNYFQSVNEAWKVRCHDVEQWFSLNHLLVDQKQERLFGSTP